MSRTVAFCYPLVNSNLLVHIGSNSLSNSKPMENKEIRLLNLLRLEKQHGGLAALAEKTSTSEKYLSQVKNRWKGRGMGDLIARRIEAALELGRGWMDTLQYGDPVDLAAAGAAIAAEPHPNEGPMTGREEILLQLYRGLMPPQQERLIVGLRALFHANQITRKHLGLDQLRGVDDQQVRDAFGDAPFHRMKKLERRASNRRDPGTAMDDFFED